MTEKGTWLVKKGFAEMFKGGVIMDVTNAEQAKIAEEAGAVAVMALERVPADIRKAGGVARMASIAKIKEIMDAVSIPVMAKVRIGHIAEARILEALGVDFIDESEVLTPADDRFHINKHEFKVPFVCGARDLGEALRRIAEGAAMIRTKGEAGTGNVVEAVKHMRRVMDEIRRVQTMADEELVSYAKDRSARGTGQGSKKAWTSACGELCSRWCRNASRRSTHDDARCRRCLCWFWHIQIQGTRKDGASDGPCCDVLERSRDVVEDLRRHR